MIRLIRESDFKKHDDIPFRFPCPLGIKTAWTELSVVGLGNILITTALPSTSGVELKTITGAIQIDLMIEEEGAKGALRLMTYEHSWINELMLNQKSHLTTHTTYKRNKTF